MPTPTPPLCPVHNTPMTPKLSAFGPWFACEEPNCDYRVSADRRTGEPLGTPTDAAGRDARKRAHAAFDALWRRDYEGNSRRRSRCYRWLASALGLTEAECHIARFDVARCVEVVHAVQALTADRADWRGVLLSARFDPPRDSAEAEKGTPEWGLA